MEEGGREKEKRRQIKTPELKTEQLRRAVFNSALLLTSLP